MREPQSIFELILNIAKADERVRAVVLNGSRANPAVPSDKYQDYDIVWLVKDLDVFTADHSWIDVFGKRLMLQMPEAMRNPSGKGHFNWMMLLSDGSRIDLTLIPISKLELLGNDSLSVTLLDKDGILPPFPVPGDRDYIDKPPSELFYMSCCNNFWWCLQNVAKGIARGELAYAMMMYHTVVLAELHDMIIWYIGTLTDFTAVSGKMGKYFKKYLPEKLYKQYCEAYSRANPGEMRDSMLKSCDLFHELALKVAEYFGFTYMQGDEDGMRQYLKMLA